MWFVIIWGRQIAGIGETQHAAMRDAFCWGLERNTEITEFQPGQRCRLGQVILTDNINIVEEYTDEYSGINTANDADLPVLSDEVVCHWSAHGTMQN